MHDTKVKLTSGNMTPSLKISQKLIDRLLNTTERFSGIVYGVIDKKNLIVLQLQKFVENGHGNLLVNSFPAEIYPCGVLEVGDGTFDEQSVKKSLTEVYVTDNPIYINYKTENAQIMASFYINGKLELTKFSTITEQEILSQYLYIRLNANVTLTCDFTCNGIKESFMTLRKNIASGVMTFGFHESNIYLLENDNENGVVGVTGNPTVGELCEESSDSGEGGTRKKKLQQFNVDVMEVNMYKRMTKEDEAVRKKEHAPLCVLDKKQCKGINILIPIDSLAIVHRQIKIVNLHEIIVESAIRNLRLLESTILLCLEGGNKISQPEIYHFYPEDCGYFITRIYLKDNDDDSLLSERRTLHQELALPLDRPIFRRANRFIFKSKISISEPIINPHIGLKPTDNGGKICLVRGKYLYYHYCQDKMDDNGWGCAYRSLQTLASWFKYQGYTNKDVPTFKDIQKCLVDIGDKPANFIGSKQWIGSTEVNYVLNTLFGVTSKILYVSCGEEISSKGPELVSHFKNNGSPVMIGGGVLAHTILGVDYNSHSGTVKFLILDPHYAGTEDLYAIQSKGWCGWKSADFWDKTTYYNMCLPQVPRCI